ncbi:hypothetical protein CEXT_340021 [Caerostris extrusa]|uniref:Uncharacterized protein n=1 Tax=Caerostris extrusa TaxID=172846 RepID=A0AAV4UDK0_CAEEX|nr:hypothetical protein CEXT_340021 [Caerostris extrusa]
MCTTIQEVPHLKYLLSIVDHYFSLKKKSQPMASKIEETPQRINFQKTTLEYEFLVIIITTVFFSFLVATQKKFMERREEKRNVRKKGRYHGEAERQRHDLR